MTHQIPDSVRFQMPGFNPLYSYKFTRSHFVDYINVHAYMGTTGSKVLFGMEVNYNLNFKLL